MKRSLFKNYFSLLFISMFCFGMTMNAQPYFYYQKYRNDTTNLGDIFRINFTTGATELFYSAYQVGTSKLQWDKTQTWLYYWNGNNPNEGPITIIKTNNPSLIKELPEVKVKYTTGVKYIPQLNRVYISSESNTYAYDDISLAKVDSFTINTYAIWGNEFSSEDGNILYCRQTDTVARKSSLTGFSLISKKIVSRRLIDQIGPPAKVKILHDGRKGKALFGYDLSGGDSVDIQYLLYDAMRDTFYTPIHFPIVSEAFLSGDAQYVIINENPPFIDPNLRNPSHTLGGKISVFEATTGKLVSKLSLPPDGQIVIFENYPNMLYYYLPYEKRSINIDLSKLAPPSGCNIKLVNSTGTKLTGGALQYYEGIWKDGINNNDGTFFVTTTAKTLSLRMTYEYGTQTKSNVTVGYDTVAFQTVNAQVQLQNSNGVLIDTGSVQYYAGAWRTLGITTNGIATKELLPANYSFRMTYAYTSKDKQQDIGTNATVVFQTVNAAIQLQNSQNTLMDQGTVQYYSGAWRDLGTTTNGIAYKELLPNNYSFRMTYAYASKDKQQDIGTNATVVFQTVKASVQLQNSLGNLIDQGTVQYYSGAWRDLGTTANGITTKELLPNNYSFRMTYAYASKDKQQDIGTNATVVFQTVNAAVQLQNSQGSLIDQGTVQYYSGAWRDLGSTTNGIAKKELLPNSYSFRMTYEYVSLDKAQDISTNNTVSFSTVLCTIRVKNSQNQLVNNAMTSYYSGAWRQIGNTVNGVITKELLPVNLSFRVKYGTQQQDKQQNLSTNNMVEFGIQ